MNPSRNLIILSSIVVLLALVAALAGLLWPGGDGITEFTTLRGETAAIYGRGLYRYDSLLTGAGFRGADVVILCAAVPALVFAILRYHQGSLRGAFLLMGMLAFFLYNYASMAVGAAYTPLFLIYVALFSTSLFGFVLAFSSFEFERLPVHVTAQMPHRALVAFMFVSGFVFIIVWLVLGILLPLVQGLSPPELASYTTMVTHALDLGVLMPAAFLAGVLLRRRVPWGYPLAFAMLMIGIFVVGFAVPAATISQLAAGYAFTPGQFIAFVVSFALLGFIALWLAFRFIYAIVDT